MTNTLRWGTLVLAGLFVAGSLMAVIQQSTTVSYDPIRYYVQDEKKPAEPPAKPAPGDDEDGGCKC